MKLGLLTAPFEQYTIDEVLDFAAANKFECLEVACWPQGKAERRYAGTSHIDVANVSPENKNEILDKFASRNVKLSAIGYYPNPLHPDRKQADAAISHLKSCIRAAGVLGVDIVNTFIGKNRFLSESDNWNLFRKTWPDIIKYAEDCNVKVAIENCPMYFKNEWPGGDNLASNPRFWRDMFCEIQSSNFGLDYDPSHLVWQRMDYIKPLGEFAEKIFFVHIKDAIFYQDKYDDVGFLAAPLDYHAPVLPGHGDIDWGRFFSALNDIHYKGDAVIEMEDRAYEDTEEDRFDSFLIAQRFCRQYI